MPKIGAYKIPNYDIEKVSNVIVESGQRIATVTAGDVPENIFQEEYIQKAGGTYQSYRYSMEQYGFIYRSKGADIVELTDLYEKVADPLSPDARENAKTQAVRNVDLLLELYEANIDRNISTEQLRRRLVVDLGIPKEDIGQKDLRRLKKLYKEAYPYLDLAVREQKSPEENEEQRSLRELGQSEDATIDVPKAGPSDNIVVIDGLRLELDADNLKEEWNRAKSTVDAYMQVEKDS